MLVARAFRDCRLACPLAIGNVAIAADGSVIAGLEDASTIVVYRTSGELVARHPWTAGRDSVVLADDGSWFASGSAHDRRDVVTGEVLVAAELPTLRGRDPRFAVTASDGVIVLWDRGRERAILRHGVSGLTDFVTVTAGGRFVIAIDWAGWVIIDLVADGADSVRNIAEAFARGGARLVASADGRFVAVTYPDVFDAALYRFDWELDPDGDRDALATRWADCERPPIAIELDAMLADRPRDPMVHAAFARNHPALEVKLARWLPPASRVEWTRRALVDPQLAKRPDVWLQLAEAALACGELDVAADAAAEGLGRDEDHADLLGVLERVAALRARRVTGQRVRWTAHAGAVSGIAIAGDRVVTGGHDSRVRWWDVTTGERLASYNTASPVTCLDAGHGRVVAGSHARGVFLFDLMTFERIARSAGSSSWAPTIWSAAHIPAEPPPAPVTAIAIGEHDIISADRFVRWWSHALEEQSLALAGMDHEPVTALRLWEAGAVGLAARGLRRYGRRGEPSPIMVGEVVHSLAQRGAALLAGGDHGEVIGAADALDGLADHVIAIAVGDALVVAADASGAVAWWRAGSPVGVASHPGVVCVATAGDIVVSGARDGSVVVWE